MIAKAIFRAISALKSEYSVSLLYSFGNVFFYHNALTDERIISKSKILVIVIYPLQTLHQISNIIPNGLPLLHLNCKIIISCTFSSCLCSKSITYNISSSTHLHQI